MAINFPDSPTNGQSATLGGNTWTYNSTSGAWARASSGGGSSITTYDSTTDLPLSGVDAGDQAFVTGSNRMYVSNGTGWYSVSLVNTNPSITSVQDSDGGSAPFTLATDGTGTVITVTASDPEDVPLTYAYSVTSGSLTNGGGTTATVVQGTDSDVNKFTITPSSTEAYAGTFELTFTASDGINQGTSANSFTLQFITPVTNSRYTTLLATATGTSDNNNITDASSSNHTITVNGDTHAGTFSPYRSGGYSTYFDGTSGIRLPATTGTNLQGATTFTVEFWYNTKTVATGNKVIWGSRSNTSNTNNDDTIGRMFQTNGSLYYNVNNLTVFNVSSVISANTWYYIALVVDSGAASLYLDGDRIATGTYTSANGSDRISVGHTANTPQQYIADFRINTAAEYSGISHTVPNESLSTTSNTVAHLSTNGSFPSDSVFTGSPSKIPFSPYDYDEYAAGDHGGSVYFDGSGDNLTVSSFYDFAGNGYSISFWFRLDNLSSNQSFVTGNNTNIGAIQFRSSNVQLRCNYTNSSESGVTQLFGPTIRANEWYYVQQVHDGTNSNNVKLYVNGVLENTISGMVSGASSPVLYIGDNNSSGGTAPLNGYVSDLKITTETSPTTTIPTSPRSSDGNTKFLLKGTDASIIDKSQGSNLKLVGTTTGSTDQVRTGNWANTKTMKFDGNSDYLTFPHRPELNFGSNDWTIECWIYPKTNVGDCGIWHQSASGTDWYSIYLDGAFNLKFVFYNSSNGVEWAGTAASNTAPQNTWTHVALVRKFGTGVYLFAGGTLVASDTNDTSVTMLDKTYDHVIGYERFVGSGTYFDGYIQDFRITNGLARYIDAQNPTTSFTPPSTPLEG